MFVNIQTFILWIQLYRLLAFTSRWEKNDALCYFVVDVFTSHTLHRRKETSAWAHLTGSWGQVCLFPIRNCIFFVSLPEAMPISVQDQLTANQTGPLTSWNTTLEVIEIIPQLLYRLVKLSLCLFWLVLRNRTDSLSSCLFLSSGSEEHKIIFAAGRVHLVSHCEYS